MSDDCKPKAALSGSLTLERAGRSFLGGRRLALLRSIHETGSISQAAKGIGMSYKAAWEAVETVNNLAAETVVMCEAGGRHGGGSRLTAYGLRLLGLCEQMQAAYAAWLQDLGEHIDEPAGLLRLAEKITLQSSARNQYLGTVERLLPGPVNAEAKLRISPAQCIIATITNTSAENMGLAKGREVHALIKASSVLLAAPSPDALFSARNRLNGVICNMVEGPVSCEVTLDLGCEKRITAVITQGSRDAMGLKEGRQACALFKASSVILARP